MPERISFTRPSAERIANAVRVVEQARPDAQPLQFRRILEARRPRAYTWVYCFNSTANGVVPKHGVMELVGLRAGYEASGITDAATNAGVPVFQGVFPWTQGETNLQFIAGRQYFYGIALQEIQPQTIGRVAISGVVAARVKVNNAYDRIAGPCVGLANGTANSGLYASLTQLESGWGPIEIVDLMPTPSQGYESHVVFVRLSGRPFRVSAMSGNSSGVGNNFNARIKIGRVGNAASDERDLLNHAGQPMIVRGVATYGRIPGDTRMLVEQQAWGEFAPVAFGPMS